MAEEEEEEEEEDEEEGLVWRPSGFLEVRDYTHTLTHTPTPLQSICTTSSVACVDL